MFQTEAKYLSDACAMSDDACAMPNIGQNTEYHMSNVSAMPIVYLSALPSRQMPGGAYD